MDLETYAIELARRLTQAEAGAFRAVGETVVLGEHTEGPCRLQLVDAGSGRTEQVIKVLHTLPASPFVAVIAGRHFSQKALEELDAAQANYMDDQQLKIRLSEPAMLVRLKEEAPLSLDTRTKAMSLSGAAGGVTLALLSEPTREWKVSDLAARGFASLGAAQNTVVALESEGLVERTGRGPSTRRRVTDPAGLLDRYAHDAAADRRVLARGFLLNNGPEAAMRAASDHIASEVTGLDVFFTGVAAAQIVAPHLTTVRTFEAWVTTPYDSNVILNAMGAMPVDEGANLVVMRGHKGVLVGSEYDRGIPRVSIFRIYTDALADPVRGEEQAEYLRETLIGF